MACYWTVPSHYLCQCWHIVNWTPENNVQWNFDQNSYNFIQENPFQNAVWKMATILSRRNVLTHCSLVVSYGLIEISNNWFRQYLATSGWSVKAITVIKQQGNYEIQQQLSISLQCWTIICIGNICWHTKYSTQWLSLYQLSKLTHTEMDLIYSKIFLPDFQFWCHASINYTCIWWMLLCRARGCQICDDVCPILSWISILLVTLGLCGDLLDRGTQVAGI